LWIATRGGGLDRLDPRTGRIVRYRSDSSRPGGLGDADVQALYEDREGTLWIGTFDGGLARLVDAAGGGRFETFVHDPDDPTSLSHDRVWSIRQDPLGFLWVATEDGLSLLDPEAESFQVFRHDPAADGSLGHSRVRNLLVDRAGEVWVGTEAGLDRFQRPTRTFEHFALGTDDPTGRTPVGRTPVDAILEDSRGVLWVGTSGAGLVRIDPATGSLRRFLHRPDAPHSLADNDVRALWEDRSGIILWIGTQGGLDKLDLNIPDPPRVPPVVLTAVRRFGSEKDLDFDLGLAPPAAEEIELSWEDAPLTFEFAALDFAGARDNRYRYMLEGLDRDWTDAGERRQASYPNLPPGRYTFRVRAASSAGVWNEEGLAVGLTIRPPFWGTAWFRLSAGLAVLAAAAVYRARVRRLKRRQRELARRMEEGLEERHRSEERYRLLFERNLAGVVRATVDGRVLDCNRAFARLLGFASRRECLGQRRVAGVQHAAFLRKLREAGRVVSYEYPLAARDGSQVALLWNAHLLVEEGGELVIEGTVIDFSERRRMEEGLLRTRKLESLALLAGGIAHDFNNLLTAILGQAELARRELPPASRARARLEQIEQAAERASGLSKQMLAYSGKGSFVTEATDVSAAVDAMASLLQGAVSDRVTLAYDLAPGLPAVDADRSQLSQVLLSLVTNASEAIGEGSGTVILTTGVLSCGREYLSATFLDEQLEEGDYVTVDVRDTGRGMDAETQRKIFDPFFTTKFDGRGLGLAAVLGIVRGHRGAIAIDSQPGRGTTMRVLLPVSGRPAAAAAPAADEEGWRGRGTVLLVDDEPQVLAVGEEMVKLLGFDVLTAADGRRGVEVFRRHAGDVDLVVLDLAMPRMDGPETLVELRRISSDVPVLLASGYDEKETMEKFADRGFAGFIPKPYRLSVLRRKLRAALEAAGRAVPVALKVS
jgi:PAS domain S-box-containing protein